MTVSTHSPSCPGEPKCCCSYDAYVNDVREHGILLYHGLLDRAVVVKRRIDWYERVRRT